MVLQVILGLDHTDHREQKQRRIAGGGAVMYSLYLKQALVRRRALLASNSSSLFESCLAQNLEYKTILRDPDNPNPFAGVIGSL